MDKTASLYYKTADELKLSPKRLPFIAGFELQFGKHRYFFRGGETPFNNGGSISVATNKYCMNKKLREAGFPVCKANAFSKAEFEKASIERLLHGLSFPLVVKPTRDTGVGYDVICNIQTPEELIKAMKNRFKRHGLVSIEEFHKGLNSYRVLVFQHKVIGVTQRFPAAVIGDGIHTIEELIQMQNMQRKELKKTVSLGLIKVDDEYRIRLKELNLSLKTIPKDKEQVRLCYTCNSTRGGTMVSLGKQICKENAKLLSAASRALNLKIVGFDVLCEDIMMPIETSRGIIVEANHNPDITIHESPMSGIKNQVSKPIIRHLLLKHPFHYMLKLVKDETIALYVKTSFVIFIAFIFLMFSRL